MEKTIDIMRRALSALLQKESTDAFVIFEDQRTKKFVQFTGSSNEGLLLDLPFQALTVPERERATLLFSAARQKDRNGADPDGIQVDYRNDVEAATAAAVQVFQDVYLLPPTFSLAVTEN